ncbi:MAG: replication protein [Clostridia bacterium]|nr:replication protein [Clostridia bacterium]
MASTRKENGFTAIPNNLLEALYSSDFTATELKVLFTVIRYTYGYRRESAQLSLQFISRANGIGKDQIAKCIRKLCADRVLTTYRDATSTTPKQLGINTDYQLWLNRRRVVRSDYSGVVSDAYSGVECEDYAGVECEDYRGVVNGDYAGVVRDDHQYINNININNKKRYKESVYAPEITEIVELFNSVCKTYTPIVKINNAIAHRISRLLEDFTLEEIKQGFEKAEKSRFLNGKKNARRVDFDWITDADNMTKILNGKYDNDEEDEGAEWAEEFFRVAVERSMRNTS